MIPFEHDGLTIHYSIEGKGKAILFLHGFLENARMWNTIAPHFAADHTIIKVDLPGHGTNSEANAPYQLESVAQTLASLLKSFELDEVFVLGHSMGGYIGLELEKLMKIDLILLHSNFWEDSKQKKQDRTRVIELVQNHKNKFISEAIPNLFDPQNRVSNSKPINALIQGAQKMSAKAISFATAAMRDRIANYKTRKKYTLIQGENDPIIPTESVLAEMKKSVPKPELKIIKNCGHMSIWEKPNELIKLLETILIP